MYTPYTPVSHTNTHSHIILNLGKNYSTTFQILFSSLPSRLKYPEFGNIKTQIETDQAVTFFLYCIHSSS